MDAAAIGERICTADSSNADLNGNTVEPSELVPSGNRTTGRPVAIAACIRVTANAVASGRWRSTKIVPAAWANQPNKGQEATSRLATKTHGARELRTMMSR